MFAIKKVFLFLFVLMNYFDSSAQNWDQTIKAVAFDRAANTKFGYSVSISGDYAVIGAIGEYKDVIGQNSLPEAGAAYIFKKSNGTWNPIQKLVPNDRKAKDNFGKAVAIYGDYAIIGSTNQSYNEQDSIFKPHAGAAYIFRNQNGNWIQVKKLVAPKRDSNDHFGAAVAITKEFAFVGAPNEDEDSLELNSISNAGSCYIFKDNNNGWDLAQKITAMDRAENNHFGTSIAISGNNAIIGNPDDDLDETGKNFIENTGSVIILDNINDKWTQVLKIVAKDRSANDQFGSSVAMSKNYAVIGSPNNKINAMGEDSFYSAGAAYMFKNQYGSWKQMQKLVSKDRNLSNYFGNSVSISGQYVLIGAYGQDSDTSNSIKIDNAGAAYIFLESNEKWTETKKLVSKDRDSFDYFGNAVAISENFLFISAFQNNKDQSGKNSMVNSGAAYIYGTPCLNIPNTIYVNINATGANDGTSWINAFNKLQDALDLAMQCDKVDSIKIAQGNYIPTSNPFSPNDPKKYCFHIANSGIKVSGGWDPDKNTQTGKETVLNGDRGGNNIKSEFVNHVMITNGLKSSFVLDKLTFTNGNSGYYNDYTSIQYYSQNFYIDKGGALFNILSSLTISHCYFKYNSAYSFGGAIYSCLFQYNEAQNIVNCIFENNSAQNGSGHGGAIYNDNTSSNISNCIFLNNSGTNGNDISIFYHATNINNCSFINSKARQMSTSIWYPSARNNLTVTNSVFYNCNLDILSDSFIYQNNASNSINSKLLTNGEGFLNLAGLSLKDIFKNDSNFAGNDGIYGTYDDGLVLNSTSKLIGAGKIQNQPILFDITGALRPKTPSVGAYEWHKTLAIQKSPNASTENFKIYPNPFTNRINISSNDLILSDYTISIASINGIEIFNQQLKKTNQPISLDLCNLSLGLYIITIRTKNSVQHQTIIKNN
jgi:predicted outer membrane repeat protein